MLQGIKLAKTSEEIRIILESSKNIAVVGSSPNTYRDSHKITKYLITQGYNVFPVNPNYNEILGIECYSSLDEIKEIIDIVDVFRKPEFSLKIAEEAAYIKAKSIWFQLGIGTPQAVQYAINHNLTVVENRCIMVEHKRLIV